MDKEDTDLVEAREETGKGREEKEMFRILNPPIFLPSIAHCLS